MTIKLFEIRDRATMMPVMAVALNTIVSAEIFLLRRAGFPQDVEVPYIVLTKFDGIESNYDPFGWTGGRTLPIAHQYIIDNWHLLSTGAVVDVEYILGESATRKASESMV